MNIHRSALLLLASTVFAITGCASDSSIVTGAKRTPIPPEQVTLYLEQPADFEIIGPVSASSGARWSEQRSVEYAIKELKKQAANLGANGLLLDFKIDTTTTMDGYKPLTAKTVQGIAIFVKGR